METTVKIDALAKQAFGRLDKFKGKKYEQLTDAELFDLVELANQALGVIEHEMGSHTLDLDFESQSWFFMVEALQEKLKLAIVNAKKQLAPRMAGQARIDHVLGLIGYGKARYHLEIYWLNLVEHALRGNFDKEFTELKPWEAILDAFFNQQKAKE